MSNWSWEARDNGGAVLRLAGEATVELMDELHALLLEGIETFDSVQIDCSATTAADFYTVQLLCSAHRTAVTRNKSLEVLGEPSAAFMETARKAGFMRCEACPMCPSESRCLWL